MARMGILKFALPLLLSVTGVSASALADTEQQDLAQELSNPIADLTSVPVQSNFDRGIGPDDDGYRLTVNIQPVVPFKLSADWLVISRTILPIIYQNDIAPGSGSQFGLGDTVQSLFLSPKPVPVGEGAFIFGAGPVALLPTGTDSLLSAKKWGTGPTAVGLVQTGPWTAGALANHIWSFAGDDDRPDINATFLQPFVAFTTPTAYTFTLQMESTYDWEREEWSVPLAAVASKLTKIGNQQVQFALGARYYAASATNGPEGFGARFVTTFLFPK